MRVDEDGCVGRSRVGAETVLLRDNTADRWETSSCGTPTVTHRMAELGVNPFLSYLHILSLSRCPPLPVTTKICYDNTDSRQTPLLPFSIPIACLCLPLPAAGIRDALL